MRRARLGRYAVYQAIDYVFERGLVTLLLVTMTLAPPLLILRNERGGAWGVGPGGAEFVARILSDVAVPIASLTVLFGIHGISSMDRQKGYFRFLFAKPARVAAYYGVDFFVRFAGVLAVALLCALALTLTSGAPLPLALVAYVALNYALLGGIGFLLSALFQFDGLMLILVYIASTLVVQLRDAYPQWVPLALVRILPPVDVLELARHAWLGGMTTLPSSRVAWAVAYGLLCFIAGLVVLARKPLAR